jgi:hypothetical protein
VAEVTEDAHEQRRWLRALYVLPVLTVVSLATLFAQDVVSEIEERRGEHGELHHLFIFDLAWPVFVVSALLTVCTGLVALVAGRFRRRPGVARYGAWALGSVVLAVVAVVLAVAFGVA